MTDSITTLTAMPALHNTMGALLVGTIVSTALWGITCMQTFEYYSTYRRHDTARFKIMVLATFVLDTLHEIFICHTIYVYLVVDFANPMQLGVVEWSIVAEVIPSTFVAFTAQTFFTYRVWILSRKNLYLTVPLVFLVVGQLAVSLVYFSKAWSVKVYANSYIVKELSQAMNAVGAVGDICITLSLIWLLHSSKSGMRRSDAMMNSLILFSLNTGLLTSICAFMSLIMILKYPDTFLYIAFFFNLSRFYSNSLLATLNARKTLKSASDKSYIAAVDGDHLSSSSVRVQRIPAHSHSHGHATATAPHHVINIVTHTETHTDKDIEAIGEYEMEQRDEPK